MFLLVSIVQFISYSYVFEVKIDRFKRVFSTFVDGNTSKKRKRHQWQLIQADRPLTLQVALDMIKCRNLDQRKWINTFRFSIWMAFQAEISS